MIRQSVIRQYVTFWLRSQTGAGVGLKVGAAMVVGAAVGAAYVDRSTRH